jgi:type I restriction enzyme S subunit
LKQTTRKKGAASSDVRSEARGTTSGVADSAGSYFAQLVATSTEVSISDVLDGGLDSSGPADDFVYLDIGGVDRERKAFIEPKLVPLTEAPSRAKQKVRVGDVLVSMTRPNLNAVALVTQELHGAIASTGFHVLRSSWLERGFLYYLVQTEDFVDAMCSVVQGALYPAVRPRDIDGFRFHLPPRPEQTRIVEKLEELLSDLDAGVAELKAAQRKLAQYRQSLLKAAVEGALTADWRAARANTTAPKETGAELLQRILTERRARWKAKQLAKFAEQDKSPPNGWQEKYKEPVAPNTTDLPALPDGWVWATLDQLLVQLRSGTAETSGRDVTPHPVLKSSAVRQGSIDLSAVNYLDQAQCRTENDLELGDLLITRLSGSVEYVGCAAIVSDLAPASLQYPDRIFCGKLAFPSPKLASHIVNSMRSPQARLRIEAAAKSTAGHKRISLSDLLPFPIPLPSLPEVASIDCLMQARLRQTENAEAAAEYSLKQSVAQRKNILKAAFAGQLVPQDPNDEAASALLERIRAERDNLVKPSALSRRKKQKKPLEHNA